MQKQDKIKIQTMDKEQVKVKPPDNPPLYWTEISDSVSHRFHFHPDGQLSVSSFISFSMSNFYFLLITLFLKKKN